MYRNSTRNLSCLHIVWDFWGNLPQSYSRIKRSYSLRFVIICIAFFQSLKCLPWIPLLTALYQTTSQKHKNTTRHQSHRNDRHQYTSQPTKKSTRLAFAEPSPAMSLISSFLILTRGLRIRLMQPFHFHVKKIPPPWADTSLIHFQGMANLKQPSKLHHPSIAALDSSHQLPPMSSHAVSSPLMPTHV